MLNSALSTISNFTTGYLNNNQPNKCINTLNDQELLKVVNA